MKDRSLMNRVDGSQHLTIEFLRKYIAFAKRNINPDLSDDAKALILEYYTNERQSFGRDQQQYTETEVIPITPRALEALIRLTEAHARMHLREVASADDAKMALAIFRHWREEAGIEDESELPSGVSVSQRNAGNTVRSIIRDLCSDKGVAELTEIFNRSEPRGVNEYQVEEVSPRMLQGWATYSRYHTSAIPSPVEPMSDDSSLENVSTSEPHGEVDKASELDPSALGFMCGLEIHQQLNTGKLHSRMPSTLYEMGIEEIPTEWKREGRRLRAAEGEGGKVDVAARFEARRNRSFVYVQSPNSGLIELDEAPPLSHDDSAIKAALTISAMMDSKPVPFLQAMRKTVVDGSNTSGFQRTTLIATDGTIVTPSGDVGIDVICLKKTLRENSIHNLQILVR